ncbi:MAG: SAM-dependent DNA methyltransferase, partial [Selenomonas sp.]|nr:SAM-dependent DNA methyltransferase [Selenomonas sp.]
MSETSNEKIQEVGRNIQEKAALVWSVADDLVGAFKPHEYGLVVLPMAVIKRFHDCLLPTHERVLAKYEEVKNLAVKEGFLRGASGYQFYNTSPFTFKTLVADPENIEDNFKAYLNGFSDNVLDILARMDFTSQINRMVEGGLLYQVISDFNSEKADFSPENVTAVDMGYIFENLVQRFSESYNEEAGAHFTSRDIIYLMCDLLVAGDRNAFEEDGISKTVYDMTMGTSQMLTCMEERLKALDSEADVDVFGQEFNPFTFGIAKADMLIRGGDPDNMQFGDTLSDDKFTGYEFDYIISNPPFGIPWKREEKEVTAEHKQGAAGRFAPGLPAKSDGQMLFLLNGVAKLKENGRMAIIQNGSSLFTGDAGSGQSEIRRYLIENDWLDAIVQLPNDSFYNTGIATYVWLITKDKPEERAGKVQLIDASNCKVSRRKNIGNKRVDITTACRDLIVNLYGQYAEGTFTETDENGGEITVKSKVL